MAIKHIEGKNEKPQPFFHNGQWGISQESADQPLQANGIITQKKKYAKYVVAPSKNAS